MFKPHYGDCKFCQREDVLIVVSKGYCQYCNFENKQKKRKTEGKSTGKYRYSRKSTGEVDVYEKVLENLPDYETRCFVCGIRVSVVTHNNMAHVLPKGKYEKFRLNPDNIVILCHSPISRLREDGSPTNGCHSDWDTKPRSELTDTMWDKMFELEANLKSEYKRKYEE